MQKLRSYPFWIIAKSFFIWFKQDDTETFTGFCTNENHPNKLDFFCKTHNKLWCVACLAEIKDKRYGQHSKCRVSIIENITEEKKKCFK